MALRLTDPFGRPAPLPDRPFRNWLCGGGGFRPSADTPLFWFFILLRFLHRR
jgi:hypothetical protein